jgi:hypothetical protein
LSFVPEENVDKAEHPGRTRDNPLAWTAVAGLVLAARFPDWLRRPRLWAEDGKVFYSGASSEWHTDILKPYAGYFHLLPRSIAWIGHRLDPALVPALFVYTSALLTLCVVARVFSRRLDLPLRPLIALAIVAAPSNGEVFLCPTNLQWIVALSLPLTAIMRDPVGLLDWVADVVVVAAAGLTGPFSIFAFPLFLWRALRRRTRASWVLAGVVGAAAVLQAWQVLFHPAPRDSWQQPFEPVNLVAVLSGHIPLAFFGAQAWVHAASRTLVIELGMVGFLATAATLLMEDRHREQRLQLAAFAAILLACTVSKVRLDTWDYRETNNADRYFYILRVVELWLGTSCLYRLPRAAIAWTTIAVAPLLALDIATPFLEGPSYAVRHEERPFYEWEPYIGPIRRGEAVEITTSPGWKFTLPKRTAAE